MVLVMPVISLTALAVRVWSSVSVPAVDCCTAYTAPVAGGVQRPRLAKGLPGDARGRRAAGQLPAGEIQKAVDAVVLIVLVEVLTEGLGHGILPPLAVARAIVAMLQPHKVHRRAAGGLPAAIDHAAEAVQTGVKARAAAGGQRVLHGRIGIIHDHRRAQAEEVVLREHVSPRNSELIRLSK